MQINIDKKFFIKLGCLIVFGVACFLAGRFIRFGGVSGASEQLVSGIVLERDTANKLLDELGIARPAGSSASDYGYAILEGIGKLRSSNQKLRLYTDEVIREIDLTSENVKIIYESISGVSDTIDYGFQLAIEESQGFERIAGLARPSDENTDENEQEPTSRPGDSQ